MTNMNATKTAQWRTLPWHQRFVVITMLVALWGFSLLFWGDLAVWVFDSLREWFTH